MHPHGTLYCSHSVARWCAIVWVNVFLLYIYAFSHTRFTHHHQVRKHTAYGAYVHTHTYRRGAFISMDLLTPALNDTVASRRNATATIIHPGQSAEPLLIFHLLGKKLKSHRIHKYTFHSTMMLYIKKKFLWFLWENQSWNFLLLII